MSNDPVKDFPALGGRCDDDPYEMENKEDKHDEVVICGGSEEEEKGKEEEEVDGDGDDDDDNEDDVKDEEEEMGKTMYLSVVRCDKSAQCIYPIDISKIPIDNDQVSRSYDITESKIELLHVLEFRRSGDFPIEMSCVEWNSSRLYFIGGKISHDGIILDSPFVFFVEISNINEFRENCEEDPTYLLRRKIVQSGPTMNSPKSEELYTFVADGRIFAICPPTSSCRKPCKFEVLDPNGGEEEEGAWSVLPDPPFRCPVTFHLVFSDEKKVLFGTFQDGYFLFDLEKEKWFDCTPDLWPALSDAAPMSLSIQLEDRLFYWDSLDLDVVCFGPADGVLRKNATVEDLMNLFKDRGSYCEDFALDLQTYAPENPVFTSLHYLGNLTFSYIIGGLNDPKLLPLDHEKSPKSSNVCMIVFTIPASDLTRSSREKREFNPQVLHVAELMCNGGGSCVVNGCITT